ncbi:MAG: tetratricopeptide repeat protein [bacterium]|nr:tetratricopeptide repeat protein [bacterium]
MKSTTGSISRQTLYLAILSALIVGFVGGVGYSAFRSASLSTQQQAGGHTHSNEAPAAEAIAALEKKAQEDPDNAEVWAELGHAFFDSGQADNAIAAYTRALAIAPDNANVRTDLGVMYFQSKKHREAISEFDRVLGADPQHPQARFNKGVVLYSGLGDKTGALAEWKALLQTHPDAITPTGMALKDLIGQVEEEKE